VLHYAAAEGNLVVVEFLLQNGANPNAADTKGWVPIHYSANNNHAGCARLLMNRGAIVSIRDNNGMTAADIAEGSGTKSVKTLLASVGGTPRS
jgi:ankyrin repeat protein